ncbi:MAG: hypothetical protein AB1649_19860 [Chloroflexota bacterium]
MKDNTAQVEQRVKRYWYTDGIGELLGGGLFVILALYFAAQQYVGDDSPVDGLLQAAFVAIVIGTVFLGRKLIHFLKAQITYPRTGYVEYRMDKSKAVLMRVLAVLVGMGVAMSAVFIAQSLQTIDAMVAITGVLVALIFLIKQGWSFGVPRFYFFSLLSLALGGILSVSGFLEGYNLGLFYALMGLTLTISGGLVLKRYLNENPLPSGADNV